MPTPEGLIVKAISKYLEKQEKQGIGYWWKVRNSRLMRQANGRVFVKKVEGGLDKTGIPDIMGVYNSICVGIEVKADKGKQSDSQKAFEEAFKWNGGVYAVVRSVDDVANLLERLKV